jgi:hypothetical protein
VVRKESLALQVKVFKAPQGPQDQQARKDLQA